MSFGFRPGFLALLMISAFSSATFASADEARRVILLTGYWSPTNEMLRPWNPNPAQNPRGWIGADWEGSGFDVVAHFPEFPAGSGSRGRGDFEINFEDTQRDFDRITQATRPIALLSFGRGDKDWELESNSRDYWTSARIRYRSTLPLDAIASAVNASTRVKAWIDLHGDADNYLCGFLSFLGARYRSQHQDPRDPSYMISQGFIHVSRGYALSDYRDAVKATLRATISHLQRTVNRMEPTL